MKRQARHNIYFGACREEDTFLISVCGRARDAEREILFINDVVDLQ